MPNTANSARPELPDSDSVTSQQSQISYLIQQAIALHRRTEFQDAREIYEQILRLQPNHFDSLQLLGVLCAQRKDYLQAVEFLSKALKVNPNHAPSHSNLGNALRELDRLDEALISFNQATSLKPDLAEAYNNRGITLKLLNRLDEALASYEKAISIAPEYAEAYNNRGNTLKELNRLDEALSAYEKAIRIKSDFAEAHFHTGVVLYELKRIEEALNSYDKALEIRPDYADAYNNRGNALIEKDLFVQALASFDKAISLKSDHAEAYNNRGNAFQALKKLEDALSSFDQAIAIKPDFANAHYNRGVVLQSLGRCGEALSSYSQAVAIKPDYAEAHYNLGNTLQKFDRFDEALASYNMAISIKPDSSGAYFNRGNVLFRIGRHIEAKDSYHEALLIKPGFSEARFSRAVSILPSVQTSATHTELCRQLFLQEMTDMENWFVNENLKDSHKAVGSMQPFYIAYQEENNQSLLSKYGSLCSKLMNYWEQKNEIYQQRKALNKPLKLGLVSGHIHQHSVWDALVRGWVENIDKNRFELFFFYTGTIKDKETEFAKSISTHFVECGELSDCVDEILKAQVDILIYPEIGMHPIPVQLASLRLAPVQFGSWGHPETTGLPTVDYYLSAELLEPDHSEKYYTEQLVKLPNLGCCYKYSAVLPESIELKKIGIAEDQPLLICPGVPFKYQPQHDHVFVNIAKKLGKCQFIFFTFKVNQLTEIFKERLDNLFLAAGMNSQDYCIFIPWQTKESFYGLMKRADVFMDTIGFSGFNTAMQAIECELPIVTREGRFMRGRLASGILKRIGLQELVALNEDDYVRLVIRLIQDKEFNCLIRKNIQERSHVLYNDLEPVKALENFIEQACSAKTLH